MRTFILGQRYKIILNSFLSPGVFQIVAVPSLRGGTTNDELRIMSYECVRVPTTLGDVDLSGLRDVAGCVIHETVS